MEVLVVLAIVVLLLALLLPGMHQAREQSRKIYCSNNLRQWGVALAAYRDEHNDFLPLEGNANAAGIELQGAWYNALPPHLNDVAYKQRPGVGVAVRETSRRDVWICPAKDLTDAFRSESGKNQFHYGMNQVLDGMGPAPQGSADTPGFPDAFELAKSLNPRARNPHLRATLLAKKPNAVFLFDIAPNSPSGSPREVAMDSWRTWDGRWLGRFHGDYANLLYLEGGVTQGKARDFYEDGDHRRGRIRWEHPRFFWGYPRP